MNWTRKASCAAAAVLSLALPAYSQTDVLNNYEAMTAWSIHQGNQDEIAMARVAKDQSASKNVTDFADRIRYRPPRALSAVRSHVVSTSSDGNSSLLCGKIRMCAVVIVVSR